MTRKQALLEAIGQINDKQIIEKLNEILDDMPLNKWTEKAIFDSIDQFILDENRIPNVTDFKYAGLPPHPVIKLRFGLHLKDFMERYYPSRKKCNSNTYYYKSEEEWKEFFITHYNQLKPTSASEFDRMRKKGTPSWKAYCSIFGILKWNELLELCSLDKYIMSRGERRKDVPHLVTSDWYINGDLQVKHLPDGRWIPCGKIRRRTIEEVMREMETMVV